VYPLAPRSNEKNAAVDRQGTIAQQLGHKEEVATKRHKKRKK
jgi:hypothetical protein